jgi:hypothetical protein
VTPRPRPRTWRGRPNWRRRRIGHMPKRRLSYRHGLLMHTGVRIPRTAGRPAHTASCAAVIVTPVPPQDRAPSAPARGGVAAPRRIASPQRRSARRPDRPDAVTCGDAPCLPRSIVNMPPTAPPST